MRWLLGLSLLVALGCTKVQEPNSVSPSAARLEAASAASAAESPSERGEESFGESREEGPEESLAEAPILASDTPGWQALYGELEKLRAAEDEELAAPVSDDEARDLLCSDEGGEDMCEGPPPWAVSVHLDSGWSWFIVAPKEGGLEHSASFGAGEIGRCGAATSARVQRKDDQLSVLVEDYLEFPSYECDCEDDFEGEPSAEDCDCYTSCGTPVEATCSMGLDPQTLALAPPDGVCSALEVGRGRGLSL